MTQPSNSDHPKDAKFSGKQPLRDHELSDVQDFGEAKYDRAKDVKTADEQEQLETERDYGRKS